MKDTYTSENGRDFRQRYSGTFGKYTTGSGKTITVYVDELTDDEVLFNDVNGAQMSARINSGVEFEFYPLNRRLTDYNGTIVYSCRKPERQWHRGVCSNNTRIIDLSRARDITVGHAVVDAIYNSKQDPLETYNQYVKGTRKNFLLSDKFAVVTAHLYLYSTIVGDFDGTQLNVESLFAQEVKDALSRSNINLKVNVK